MIMIYYSIMKNNLKEIRKEIILKMNNEKKRCKISKKFKK